MDRLNMIKPTDRSLDPIAEKVRNGDRLNFEDGLKIENTPDIHTVMALADCVREIKNGNRVGYILNTHIDYTNICSATCKFCAFYRRPGDPDAYVLSPGEVLERIGEWADEIHLIGGINPQIDLDYYLETIKLIRDKFPDATIKALTAVEYFALARREKMTVEDLLTEFKNAGLGMLPGGGAEIFHPDVRKKILVGKADADEWLDVHRTAHKLGIASNCTMLHGHIEGPEHRVDHLMRLRNLQDETGGFIAHVILPYLHGSNDLNKVSAPPDGINDIRQIALARLILDNIQHIKSYWRVLGPKLAQIGLRAGADDLDGTIVYEEVMLRAGIDAPLQMGPEQLEDMIREVGLEPFRRNSLHRPIEEVAA
ncbi:MAG TPA: CofH family radical SAM protein [bacterium]